MRLMLSCSASQPFPLTRRTPKMADNITQHVGRFATPAQAVQWACVTEATAPKVGNVDPGHSFADLCYDDFVTAAEIAANAFGQTQHSVAQRALIAAQQVNQTIGSNVNLGILLLLVPLIAADESQTIERLDDWTMGVKSWLQSLRTTDSEALFKTIQVASAGGLGTVDEMDVNEPATSDSEPTTRDIVAAMRLARRRDRIARQYADDFRDLITQIVPIVQQSIVHAGDVLQGIADAHLALLAMEPDSLIARKCGIDTAREVQRLAAKLDVNDAEGRESFDQHLRSRGNQLNPGTTADLIAASLYVLTRTPNTPQQ
ncbi:MAG: triphosphoribosyl-dephospho-CoA synthase [Pirellulaceae bacterium]|nr:triphosphoribosyl-dephospho-CoA synthase [Pirellulaceae bacterium]